MSFKTKTINLPKFLGKKWIEIELEDNKFFEIYLYEMYKMKNGEIDCRVRFRMFFIIPFVKQSNS